jgi:hypothetical protein
MKLCLIYNKDDHKLSKEVYSQCYRNMFIALKNIFEEVQDINENCHVKDINADVILFFDPHSSHNIGIEDIGKSDILKLEYINDPHQIDEKGQYKNKDYFFKLGAKNRIERCKKRNIDFIICPYKIGYYKMLAPFIGQNADEKLLHFPVCPSIENFPNRETKLKDRKKEIIGNGAICKSIYGFYDFRRWAFNQNGIRNFSHCVSDENTPKGEKYGDFLSEYIGALALCNYYVVPKYLEIPLAGCLTFAQENEEYRELGFKDYKNCVYVNKNNFNDTINDFLGADIGSFQKMADKGRELVENNYTAIKFAEYIKNIVGKNYDKGFLDKKKNGKENN